MFHPLGHQPPAVYWRRRFLVLGSIVLLIVLVVLTVDAVTSGKGGPASGSSLSTHAAQSPSTPSPPPPSTHASSRSTASGASTSTSGSTSVSSGASTSPAPLPCAAKDLAVAAVAGQSSYHVGDQPLLELQVTNTGPKPCVEGLADKQVELRVYNGESRVWGSHDCQIQPGTDDRTLGVDMPVRVQITWSGLTSQPKCAGTRQRVGAGTYTLYAVLAGKTGKATQFTIS
jgi:hypothetical protein